MRSMAFRLEGPTVNRPGNAIEATMSTEGSALRYLYRPPLGLILNMLSPRADALGYSLPALRASTPIYFSRPTRCLSFGFSNSGPYKRPG